MHEPYPEDVTDEVREQLFSMQRRCVECGSTYAMHVHHRIFRSEHEIGLFQLLTSLEKVFEDSYGRPLIFWGLHQIQNLVVLCLACHEGGGVGIHGGNIALRDKYRFSFTDPLTGFNIKFESKKQLF